MSTTESPPLVREFVMSAHGNFERVESLYAEHPDLLTEVMAETGEDALGAAAHTGQTRILYFLLEQGAPLTIHAAAALGDWEAFGKLIDDEPALMYTAGAHNISLFYHVGLGGNPQIAEHLIGAGVTHGLETVILAASKAGQFDMIRWGLDNGSNPMQTDMMGRNALEIAVEKGDQAIAELLRERVSGWPICSYCGAEGFRYMAGMNRETRKPDFVCHACGETWTV